jgi:branched-chain amino acid transport system substrate-binding protein
VQTKTTLRAVAGLAVVSAALVACGSSSSGGNTGASGGKPSYTIACQGPLTGDNSALGINICDGAKLAIDQANSSGNLPFTLVYKGVDDQGTPDGARPASASIVGDSNIVAVVGPAFSGASQASEQTFAQAGLLSETPSATLPSLTDPSNHFTTFYRAVATDNAQGTAAAQYLKQVLNVSKVYTVDDAEAYGQGLATTLDNALTGEGVSVTHDSVPQGTKQWEPEAAKVKASGAQAVYFAGYYSDAAPFVKALRGAGYTGIFMSDDGTKDQHFVSLAGASAANGSYFTCQCSDATTLKTFATAYQSAFQAAPGAYSAEAYDVANDIIQGMKTLGAHVTRAALVSQVAHQSYTGITKTIAFGSNHELVSTTIYLYKVVNGQITYLGPVSKLLSGS